MKARPGATRKTVLGQRPRKTNRGSTSGTALGHRLNLQQNATRQDRDRPLVRGVASLVSPAILFRLSIRAENVPSIINNM